MSGAPKPYITPEQYLEQERQAQFKSECSPWLTGAQAAILRKT